MTSSTTPELARRASRRASPPFNRLCAGLAAAALTLIAAVFVASPAHGLASGLTPAQVQSQQWWISRLSLRDVWKLSEGAGQTVAVLDTGVDAHDADLRGAVVAGFDTTGSGNGQTDTDPAQHGTRMADTIAARGTGFGLLGVARQAKILPVVVPDATQAQATVTALNRLSAMPHPPSVANMSYGSSLSCPADMQAAVTKAIKAGIVLVAASGNISNSNNVPQAPGNCHGVVAVGAVDQNAKLWSGSNTGSYVSLAGPGVHMVGEDHQANSPNGYGYGTGTSDAAAVVSGAVADVRAKFPNETPRQIVARLLYTAHQVEGAAHSRNNQYGYGVALPLYAMTSSVPANAPNPIYDSIGLTASNPTGTPTSSAPSSSPSSTPSSSSPGAGGTHTVGGGSSAPSHAASSSSDSGPSAGLIIGIVVAVIVVLLIVVLFVRSRRPAHQGPPGGPYGGPPTGGGPYGGPPQGPPPQGPPPQGPPPGYGR